MRDCVGFLQIRSHIMNLSSIRVVKLHIPTIMYLLNLASRLCPYDGDYRCGDNRCIRSAWVCNRYNNCRDGSDEVNCSKYTIPCIVQCSGEMIIKLSISQNINHTHAKELGYLDNTWRVLY